MYHQSSTLGLCQIFLVTSKIRAAYFNSFDLKTSRKPSLRHAEAAFQTHKTLMLNVTSAAQAHWAALWFYQCWNLSLLSGLFCKVRFLWEPCGPHPAGQCRGFSRREWITEERYCRLYSTSLPAVLKVHLSKAAHVNTHTPRSLELNTWMSTYPCLLI